MGIYQCNDFKVSLNTHLQETDFEKAKPTITKILNDICKKYPNQFRFKYNNVLEYIG